MIKTAHLIISVIIFAYSGKGEDVYFDVGSLGRETWVPSSNYVDMALSLSAYYCLYNLSDQQKLIETSPFSNTLNNLINPVVVTNFSVNGINYRCYTRSIKAFVQPYGELNYYIIAIQHYLISKMNQYELNHPPPPFTIYFNLANGHFGKNLGLPITLYSPGPPYSYQKKGAY